MTDTLTAAHRDTGGTRARYAEAHANLRKTQAEMLTPDAINEMLDGGNTPLDDALRAAHIELAAATDAAHTSGWLLR